MRRMKLTNLTITVLFLTSVAFADVTVRQRVTVSGQGTEQTRMIKGARERRETKITMAGEAAQMADMMPSVATITQCDARRTLQVNDKKKLYTAEPFGDDTTTATPAKATAVTTRKGGTVTITYSLIDTGERKQMFGLTARHLKVSQSMVSSADSCSGAQTSKMEIDGWYADFSADFSCPIDLPDAPVAPSRPDCRDRIIMKRSGTARLGFLLDGTMTMFDGKGNAASSIRTETLEISRSPISAGLFDVGSDYRLVTNSSDLYAMPSMSEMMSMAGQQGQPRPSASSTPASLGRKSVGLSPIIGGGAGKVDQDSLLRNAAGLLNNRGFFASPASSGEVASGRFDYVIGVEIVSAKQSKAGKIGGFFGKVTGNTDAAKAGDSEVDVVVTAYQKDGKTVIARQPFKQKSAGSPDDAARSAIENALSQLIAKIN